MPFQLESSQYQDEIAQGKSYPLTPVEERRLWRGEGDLARVVNIWVKRDDLWSESGIAFGGKARTAGLVCRRVLSLDGVGFCLALARNSSVPGMVSRLAKFYNLKLHVHIPKAKSGLSPVFVEARRNGAAIFEHEHGYMTVLRAALRKIIHENPGLYEIGIGLDFDGSGAVEATEAQVENLPRDMKRVVVPVGSGGMLMGVVNGLQRFNIDVPVVGVCVARPPKINWPKNVELVQSSYPFDKDLKVDVDGLNLDPTYESKCFEFLREGDLLWIVGHRDTE